MKCPLREFKFYIGGKIMNEIELSPIEEKFYDVAKKYIENIQPQVEIGRYRVDFLIPQNNVVIELDGHDYHKTKEQRTNDSKRERWLKTQSYEVLRYTGTEIHNNTTACVYELIKFLDTLRYDDGVSSKKAIYVDGEFINRSIFKFARRNKEIYGERMDGRRSLKEFLKWIAEMSRWEGDIDLYLFSIPSKLVNSIFKIDIDVNKPIGYFYGNIYIKYYLIEIIVPSLMEHMLQRKEIISDVLLVADDLGYENYLKSFNIKPIIFTDWESELRIFGSRWFDIDYVIAKLYDLEIYEIY